MTDPAIRTAIEGSPLKGLDPDSISLLEAHARIVSFQPGELVMTQGLEAKSFYVIRRGRVMIEMSSGSSGVIPIQSLSEGDLMGWSWILPPYRWHFDGRAVELTRAVEFDGVRLRSLGEENPRFGYSLLKVIARLMLGRVQATQLQALDVYGKRH